MRIGPVGERLLVGYRGAVAAVARAGISVIVDEVLVGEGDWKAWQEQLGGLDVCGSPLSPTWTLSSSANATAVTEWSGWLAAARRRAPACRLRVRVDTAVMDPAAAAAAILAAR